ncbi:MAG: hypothetical protein JKY02_09535 [Flavobacteriaceae bacterium]|nr:hypothetical protein [Flavobacteriaceae bacterium]
MENQQPEFLSLKSDNESLKLDNGTLFYKDVPFYGTLEQYDAVNETENLCEYVAGKKQGKETKKYLNDTLAEERFYKKGLKVGVHKGFWKNGALKFEYHYNEKGVYHGTFKEWYQNGQALKEFNYINGKENGSQKMWLMNGNIRANYVVKDGERFGLIGLKKCYTVNVIDEKI